MLTFYDVTFRLWRHFLSVLLNLLEVFQRWVAHSISLICSHVWFCLQFTLHPLKKKMSMDNNCFLTVSEMLEFHGEIGDADDIKQHNDVLVHKVYAKIWLFLLYLRYVKVLPSKISPIWKYFTNRLSYQNTCVMVLNSKGL